MATAGQLVSDDLIADIDGGEAVKVVANALTQTSETVYNFEVEGAHSYFADDLGLWVHNGRAKRGGNAAGVKVHGKCGTGKLTGIKKTKHQKLRPGFNEKKKPNPNK